MSYHLGNTGTLVKLATSAASVAASAAAETSASTKSAAIEAAKAKAREEMERQAKANLTINALLIKNAKVEKSQAGGKLSQARWDYHAGLMRGSRYAGLVPAVKAALDARIVDILGPRPTSFTLQTPSLTSRVVPPSLTSQAPVVVGPNPDEPPAADVPVAPIDVELPGGGKREGDTGGGSGMLIAGAAAVAIVAFLAMRK